MKSLIFPIVPDITGLNLDLCISEITKIPVKIDFVAGRQRKKSKGCFSSKDLHGECLYPNHRVIFGIQRSQIRLGYSSNSVILSFQN